MTKDEVVLLLKTIVYLLWENSKGVLQTKYKQQLEVFAYTWQQQLSQKSGLSTLFTHGHHRIKGNLAYIHQQMLQQLKMFKVKKNQQTPRM